MILELVLFLNIFYVSDSSRRITNGTNPQARRYVVYLIEAEKSKKYDYWLCGGAAVSSLFIITSAACVEDVEFMYVVSGMYMYYTSENIHKNKCANTTKKKVVYTCVPKKYKLDYNKLEDWSFIDIALAKVESAYDLTQIEPQHTCFYPVEAIPINYDPRFQRPGTDTVVFGWGHSEFWRQEGDHSDYNKPNMENASAKVIDKETCKKSYEVYPNMSRIIDEYMICTSLKGEVNSVGAIKTLAPPPKKNGCQTSTPTTVNNVTGEVKLILNGEDCDPVNDAYQDILIDATRRQDSNQTLSQIRELFNQNKRSRRNGICQNDHGGPLVTWVAGKEILIGVASTFLVTKDNKCTGPYLYTSTYCNGAFLDCVLKNSLNKTSRRAICDSALSQKGYRTVERHISWRFHPDGPADDERTETNAKYVDEKEKKSD